MPSMIQEINRRNRERAMKNAEESNEKPMGKIAEMMEEKAEGGMVSRVKNLGKFAHPPKKK